MKQIIAILYLLFVVPIFLMAEIIPPQEILPLESYGYDECFNSISQKTNQPVAVHIVCFNRPNHFADLLISLEKNPESQTLPFYFFLDGGNRATQSEHTALIKASGIKDKTIIARSKNYGCPKNHIDAKRFMFDWCGYKKVIILEEDFVVSPSFLSMSLKLNSWMQEKYKNIVGITQSYSYCYLSLEEKRARLNNVFFDAKQWWSLNCYCLTQNVWNKMSPFLYTYERFIDLIPEGEVYDKGRSKPTHSSLLPSIKTWTRQYVKDHFSAVSKIHINNNNQKTSQAIYNKIFSESFLPNQDNMTAIALWLAGGIKFVSVVNRAKHIGKEGISTDQAMFNKVYKQITLDEFVAQDNDISSFLFVSKCLNNTKRSVL